MPIEFCTSLTLDLVYARWWGHMTSQARRENFQNYLNDAHYKPGRAELIDLSGIQSSDFDFERAKSVIHQIKEAGPPRDLPTQRVLWAPGDVPYGCARMFQAVAEVMHNGQVEVYRDEFQALQALSMPFDQIHEMLAEGDFIPQSVGRTHSHVIG